MEKTNSGLVVPLNIGWSDAGNWNSLWKLSSKMNTIILFLVM